MAAHASPEKLLRCIEAVLECREALAVNVKPKFAVDAMVATVGQALRELTWVAGGACRRLGCRRLSLRQRSCRHAALAQSVEHLTRNE